MVCAVNIVVFQPLSPAPSRPITTAGLSPRPAPPPSPTTHTDRRINLRADYYFSDCSAVIYVFISLIIHNSAPVGGWEAGFFYFFIHPSNWNRKTLLFPAVLHAGKKGRCVWSPALIACSVLVSCLAAGPSTVALPCRPVASCTAQIYVFIAAAGV